MRHVAQKGDPVLLELRGGPDARDEEELRAADHSGGEDDLAGGGDGELGRDASRGELHADGGGGAVRAGGEEDAFGVDGDRDGEVGPAEDFGSEVGGRCGASCGGVMLEKRGLERVGRAHFRG